MNLRNTGLEHPARIIVVYPTDADAAFMSGTWSRVLRKLRPDNRLTVEICSLDSLRRARLREGVCLSLSDELPSPIRVDGD